jgi:hypothetical protein
MNGHRGACARAGNAFGIATSVLLLLACGQRSSSSDAASSPDSGTSDSGTDAGAPGRDGGRQIFEPAVNYAAGTGPICLTSADFNGDGKPDLAVANSGNLKASGNVSILLGNGDGTFKAATNYGAGTNPVSVVSADFNGDGKPDLAVANSGGCSGVPGNVSILFGNGDGTFGSPVNYAINAPFASQPSFIASADLNGDGKPDLAVTDELRNNVSIFLATDAGMFAGAVAYSIGSSPTSVAIGDLNGDGKPDLAVTNSVGCTGSGNVGILLGNGDGTFMAAVEYTVGSSPRSVTIRDFNGDGKPDIAVDYQAGTYPVSVTTEDFNGDGKPDLAVANVGSGNVSILLGNGDGTFEAAINYGVGTDPQSVTSADFNGDGKPDLAVANVASDNVSVLLNSSGP